MKKEDRSALMLKTDKQRKVNFQIRLTFHQGLQDI